MYLRFIGTDGLLGLRHGEVYKVRVLQGCDLFYVCVKGGWISEIICPYETLVGFAKNWALPK